jgi:nucleotide-binding universal stress UspA family protein
MAMPTRTYLVVVDDSAEAPLALRYAAMRARLSGGRVAMLRVVEPEEGIQPWAGVEATLTEDAMARAKVGLAEKEKLVETISGSKPVLYIRQGVSREVLVKVMEEQPDISVLVLAAKTGDAGPGPLVSYLTSAKGLRVMKIPLVIVPDTYKFPEDNRPL